MNQSIKENPFTPEPWTVTPSPDYYGHYVLEQAVAAQEQADTGGMESQEAAAAQDVANARLMQSAPQLLAVARSLLVWRPRAGDEPSETERFLIEAQEAALRAVQAGVGGADQ